MREGFIASLSDSESTLVRAQLERLLSSEIFAHAERQKRFLTYLTEKRLADTADKVTQFGIGQDVFDRDTSFDPTTDSIVRVEAGRLRSKLSEYYTTAGADDPVVIGLPKGGYVLSIERPVKSSNDVHPTAPTSSTSMPWIIVLGCVAALAIVALSFATRQQGGTEIQEPSELPTATRISIGVLPFVNMSDDPQQEYFSDGITEDIITDLSIISDLDVISRNSTFLYKGKSMNVRALGNELGVSHILEGSVRKSGDRLRITAQLIEVQSDTHVWAQRFDRNVGEIFDLQDEVVTEIISALSVILTENEVERLGRKSTENVVAHDAFLRAKEQFYLFNKQGVLASIDLFSLAARLDPDFAEAYAWKSEALVFAYISGFITSPDETVSEAIRLAEHAIEIDATLPSAHANLAWAKRWNGEIEEAQILIDKATQLNPNSAEAFLWQSLILSTAGEGDEALAAIEHSNRLNPNYGAPSIFAIGRVHFVSDRFDQAIEVFDRGIDRNPNFLPNHIFKYLAYERKGDLDGAIAAKAMLVQINPDFENSAAYKFCVLHQQTC